MVSRLLLTYILARPSRTCDQSSSLDFGSTPADLSRPPGACSFADLDCVLPLSRLQRPYGRGGVGVKPAVISKTSVSSTSPPPSIYQSQSSLQPQSPPPPSHQQSSSPDENRRYEYYQNDFDDNQSTLSTIPAPKRTQQWIQQHSNLPSPPNSSSGGEPSVVYPINTNHRDLYPQSPSPSSYEPSQYSRGSDPHNPYARDYQQQQQQQHYPGGYVPSNRHRLPNVDEDRVAGGGGLEDQFGRLDVNGRDRGQSTSSRSRNGPATVSSFNGARSPAGTFTSRYMGSEEYYDDRSRQGARPEMVDTSSPRGRNAQPGPPDSATHQILQQYLAQQGISSQQPYFDQYSTQSRSPQSSQTRELQSQIESLRDAERKARERLEALRKDDARSAVSGGSSAGTRKDDQSVMSRLEVMGIGAGSEANSPRPGSGPRRDREDSGGRLLTTQERALIEKEKLRQRDMERERELRGQEMERRSTSPYGQQPQQPSPPPMDPLAALLMAQQQQQLQQQQMQQQPNLLMQALAAQAAAQQLQSGVASPPAGGASLPQTGFGDVNQQQLIMQVRFCLAFISPMLTNLATARSTTPSATTAASNAGCKSRCPTRSCDSWSTTISSGSDEPRCTVGSWWSQRSWESPDWTRSPTPAATTPAASATAVSTTATPDSHHYCAIFNDP